MAIVYTFTTAGAGSIVTPTGTYAIDMLVDGAGGAGDESSQSSTGTKGGTTTDFGGGGGGGGGRAVTTGFSIGGGVTVYYSVGSAAQASWINTTANSAPANSSQGVLANGGANSTNTSGGLGGTGAIGNTLNSGANGGFGGANFAGNGGNSAGGSAGGYGSMSGGHSGSGPGAGGGGSFIPYTSGQGNPGQVRITIYVNDNVSVNGIGATSALSSPATLDSPTLGVAVTSAAGSPNLQYSSTFHIGGVAASTLTGSLFNVIPPGVVATSQVGIFGATLSKTLSGLATAAASGGFTWTLNVKGPNTIVRVLQGQFVREVFLTGLGVQSFATRFYAGPPLFGRVIVVSAITRTVVAPSNLP